jgi:protein-S-isoprenylcysteine O-methyltransferase Ste14
MRPNINLPEGDAVRGTKAGFVYALIAYALFQAAFAYFILFLNDVWVPKGVSDGQSRPWPVALAIDTALVLFWGLQHSIMARRSFKERWTRIVPAHTERATYGLASGIALMIVMLGWVPVEGTIWSIEAAWARALVIALQVFGWLLLVAASFEIDHYETFGLKQPYYAMKGKEPDDVEFQARRIYRVVRHPIQTGIFVGMWAAPTMSASRFVFAVLMTGYISVGLYFEERDLVRQFGERYRRYRREVPPLLPWKLPSSAGNAGPTDD